MAASSLIAGVRRRLQIQILLTQALVALSIGAAGLVLLLILGTQVLDLYWPLLLALGSFGYLVYRIWRRLPTAYQSAQVLDQRLAMSDLFSTAYHFSTQTRSARTESLIQTADESALQYRPADAAPFALPNGWLRAATLATVALSLLVVRYAFQSSLDLTAPIAPGMYELLASGEKPTPTQAKAKRPEGQPLEGVSLNDMAREAQEERANEKGQEPANETASNPSESAQTGQKAGQSKDSMAPSEEGEDMDGSEKGDAASAGDKNSKGDEGGKEGEKGGADADKKQAGMQNQGNQPGDKSSLLDKFKDAMANMMNKLKSPDKSEGQQQQAQNKKDGQEGAGQQQQQKSGEGQKAEGKQQAGGQQQSEQEGQQGESSEKGQQQNARGDKSGEPSGDQKSGQGKQDGSKDIQLAEQQRAMGKISEVFGKRAQNLQGEVLIEVSSSKSQALKTDYSSKSAAHSDTSGVIQRDEVPLIFQNYVQKYFEEIRKTPPPARKDP